MKVSVPREERESVEKNRYRDRQCERKGESQGDRGNEKTDWWRVSAPPTRCAEGTDSLHPLCAPPHRDQPQYRGEKHLADGVIIATDVSGTQSNAYQKTHETSTVRSCKTTSMGDSLSL